MTEPTAAGPMIVWAAVASAAVVSLRLGRMRAAARWLDTAAAAAVAAILGIETWRPGLLIESALARPPMLLTAAAVVAAAFALQSAAGMLRGLVFGAVAAWGGVAAVATAATPATLLLALSATAWLIWGETARADASDRPVLASRRLVLTLAADGPLLLATALLIARGFTMPWEAIGLALAGDAAWSLIVVGVWSSAAVRLGLFPLSAWRGRTSGLGRGPAAVAGPLLAVPAGLVLLDRFGARITADPAAAAIRTALPVSAAALALIAAAQSDRRAMANVAASAAAALVATTLGNPWFPWLATLLVLAGGGVLLAMPGERRSAAVLPEGAARRLGQSQFYVNDLLELSLLPVRGLAQLVRFFDAGFVASAVMTRPGRLLSALDAELDAGATSHPNAGRRWPRFLAAGLLITAVAAAWWVARSTSDPFLSAPLPGEGGLP